MFSGKLTVNPRGLCDQLVSFRMARHPRLGARSPARRVSEGIARLIASFLVEGRVVRSEFGMEAVPHSDGLLQQLTRPLTPRERSRTSTGLGLVFFDPVLAPSCSHFVSVKCNHWYPSVLL